MSWTDYRDRLEEDSLNVAVSAVLNAPAVVGGPGASDSGTQPWEVIIHFAINAHNHCYR